VRAAFVLLAACASHQTPRNEKTPEAGVSIALYAQDTTAFGVVDDRRWVEVAGDSIMLANVDPGAALASLVIEPSDPALRIGTCVRERLPDPPPKSDPPIIRRIEPPRAGVRVRERPAAVVPIEPRFAPAVRCDVSGRPGRYLVRIVYVTSRLAYRAQHDVDINTGGARVTSRFAIATPYWHERADVVVYDGVPGGEHTPSEVVRGSIELDGSTAVLALPTRDAEGHVLRVYDGAVIASEDTTDPAWGKDSTGAIWVSLELKKLRLAPGPVHVHLELPGEGIRESDVSASSRKGTDDELRLPLWIDETLRGTRQRVVEYNDGAALTERVLLGVANLGDTPREVWIEEHLRTASKRKLERAWPKKPIAVGDILRSKLDAKPGRIERTGYTLEYEF